MAQQAAKECQERSLSSDSTLEELKQKVGLGWDPVPADGRLHWLQAAVAQGRASPSAGAPSQPLRSDSEPACLLIVLVGPSALLLLQLAGAQAQLQEATQQLQGIGG